MDPDFRQRLLAMKAASPSGRLGLKGPNSGYRSEQQQQEMRRLYPNFAARGRSPHQDKRAADLQGDMDWAHEHAAEYGIRFPMGHEPWHAQPVPGAKPLTEAQRARIKTAKTATPDKPQRSLEEITADIRAEREKASAGMRNVHDDAPMRRGRDHDLKLKLPDVKRWRQEVSKPIDIDARPHPSIRRNFANERRLRNMEHQDASVAPRHGAHADLGIA